MYLFSLVGDERLRTGRSYTIRHCRCVPPCKLARWERGVRVFLDRYRTVNRWAERPSGGACAPEFFTSGGRKPSSEAVLFEAIRGTQKGFVDGFPPGVKQDKALKFTVALQDPVDVAQL